MKIKRLGLATLALGLLVTGRANAGLVVDQSNASPAIIGLGISPPPGFSPLGQTFTPGLGGIDFATFNLQNFSTGATTIDVSLYDGIGVGGTLLATSGNVTIPGGFGGSGPFGGSPVRFDFSGRIALTPGSIYTLIVNSVAGASTTAAFFSADAYSGGVAINRGNPSSITDALFSEGLVEADAVATPEPSTLVGAALAGLRALVIARRRKAAVA